MKTFPIVLVLIKAMFLYGCQEKISPELEKTDQVKNLDDVEGKFYFRVINTADKNLGFELHQTGPGNKNKSCSINSSEKFSNLNFEYKGSKDITCFLEAEELALYQAGLKFKLESSANSCKFVRYTPFSYYNRMPGDSTTDYYKTQCSDGVYDGNINEKFQPNSLINYKDSSGKAKCNSYVNSNIDTRIRESFLIESENDLCRFNYKDKGKESCDIGKITINTRNFIHVPATASSPEKYEFKDSVRTINCGGKVMNCVKGPITFETPAAGSPRTAYISEQPEGKNIFIEKNYSPLETQNQFTTAGGTYTYANYKRELANSEIDYGKLSYESFESFESYFKSFEGEKLFDPNVMEKYSQKFSAVKDNIEENKYYSQFLASDPFVGRFVGKVSYRINPFYTFECLDAAREPMARIRLIVRDWDRIFNSDEDHDEYTEYMEYLTDIFNNKPNLEFPEYARMDYIPFVRKNAKEDDWEEIFEKHDESYFNDYDDWDDILPMIYIYKDNIYRPIGGDFNPENFPMDHKLE